MSDDEFDLTCKCGPNHDECAVECACACHDYDEAVKELARNVLTMAADGGMPDTFWGTDYRTTRAAQILGMTPQAAREYGQANCVRARQ